MNKSCFFCSLVACLAFLLLQACQSETEIKRAQFYTNGKSLFTEHCANCHGEKGEGLGSLYPPLTDTAFLRANRSRLACLVKYGLHEELIVQQQRFDTEMPGKPELTEQEIAYILTYLGNSFGNELGLVSTEEVNTQLKKCK